MDKWSIWLFSTTIINGDNKGYKCNKKMGDDYYEKFSINVKK
jgi:hypothetical protein